MASKNAGSYSIQCQCGKKTFPSKQKAREICSSRKIRDGQEWNFYKCPFNRHLWHLGHPTGHEPQTREGNRIKIEVDKRRNTRMGLVFDRNTGQSVPVEKETGLSP